MTVFLFKVEIRRMFREKTQLHLCNRSVQKFVFCLGVELFCKLFIIVELSHKIFYLLIYFHLNL